MNARGQKTDWTLDSSGTGPDASGGVGRCKIASSRRVAAGRGVPARLFTGVSVPDRVIVIVTVTDRVLWRVARYCRLQAAQAAQAAHGVQRSAAQQLSSTNETNPVERYYRSR